MHDWNHKSRRGFPLRLSLTLVVYYLAAAGAGMEGVGATETADYGDIEVDATSLEYLSKISTDVESEEKVKDRWVNGRFNVLPDAIVKQGFADTVDCFKPYSEEVNSQTQARLLHFNLTSIEPSHQPVAVQLVLKLVDTPTYAYILDLLEGESSKKLDSQTVPVNKVEGWLELSVYQLRVEGWNPHPKDNYALTLKLTSEQGDPISDSEAAALYRSISPRLVVYTYINESMNSKLPDVSTGTAKRSTTPQTDHCGVRTFSTTWEELGWPGAGKSVFLPMKPTVDWTFCDGHCNQPLANGTMDMYTDHARIIQSMRIQQDAPVPPAGCVAATLNKRDIYIRYLNDRNRIGLVSYYPVLSCSCV